MKNKCACGNCCRCWYGERSYIDYTERYYDLMHDIGLAHRGIQRRLKKGFEMTKTGE